MDDRLKESVSALIDDEVNELELRRILSHTDHDELNQTLKSYCLIQDALVSERARVLDIDVRAAVFRSIEQDGTLADSIVEEYVGLTASADSASPAKSRAGGFVAIAASIAFALFFVFEDSLDNRDGAGSPMVASLASDAREKDVSVVNSVGLAPGPVVELNAEQVAYFNRYLLRHSEHSALGVRSSVMPLVRVASVNSVGI